MTYLFRTLLGVLIALELIEKLINEPGMAYRLKEKFREAA